MNQLCFMKSEKANSTVISGRRYDWDEQKDGRERRICVSERVEREKHSTQINTSILLIDPSYYTNYKRIEYHN